jgi:amino acid transporter
MGHKIDRNWCCRNDHNPVCSSEKVGHPSCSRFYDSESKSRSTVLYVLSYLNSFKITSLILVTVLGIVQLARGKASTSFREPLFAGSSTSPSSYSLALYSGLWAFDGWDQANFVGGEMSQPEKNIPRAIHSSMILVTVCIQFICCPIYLCPHLLYSFYSSWPMFLISLYWTKCVLRQRCKTFTYQRHRIS